MYCDEHATRLDAFVFRFPFPTMDSVTFTSVSDACDGEGADFWYHSPYYENLGRKAAKAEITEVARMAKLVGEKRALDALVTNRSRTKSQLANPLVHYKKMKAVQQVNCEFLRRFSHEPRRLKYTGFYVKTQDGVVHHVREKVCYVATEYKRDNRKVSRKVSFKSAQYNFPLWIKIEGAQSKALGLFIKFTTRLHEPLPKRVAQNYLDVHGSVSTTTLYGIFDGYENYEAPILKSVTDGKSGRVIPYQDFCDKWIEHNNSSDDKRIHTISPWCVDNRGMGTYDDPYVSSWAHLYTVDDNFRQHTSREHAVDEMKALGVFPQCSMPLVAADSCTDDAVQAFLRVEEKAILQSFLLGDHPDVPEPVPIYS